MPKEIFFIWYYEVKGEEKFLNKPTQHICIYRNTELKDSTLTYFISSVIYLFNNLL